VLEHAESHGEEAHGHAEGPPSMMIPVGVLTVLASIGGLLVGPGLWEPLETWLDTVAEPLVVPGVAEDYASSLVAVTAGSIGIFVAWRVVRAGAELIRWHVARTILEHKLYFDELYDHVFSRPAQVLALRLRDDVEQPLVQRSIDEVGRGTLEAGGGVARAQTGLLRAYAFVITASVIVLSVVFVIVR
jgi:NADH-quinone oxidoreductase subunit L